MQSLKATILFLAMLCGLLLMPVQAGGDAAQEREAQLRSAFLLNFIRYSHWPENAFANENSPIQVIVLGDDEMNGALNQAMRNQQSQGREIELLRMAIPDADNYDTEDDYEDALDAFYLDIGEAHLLYVSSDHADHIDNLLTNADLSNTLTVGANKTMAEDGLMLGFGKERNRLMFYANEQALDESDVMLSSQVLRLAQMVESE